MKQTGTDSPPSVRWKPTGVDRPRLVYIRLFTFIRSLVLVALCIQPLYAADIQEFSAQYEIFYGEIHLGKANYRFSHKNGNSYRFEFDSKLRFLIFWDQRSVSSDLVYEDQRMLPSQYRHDRKGTGRDYREEILFDRPNNRIIATYGIERPSYRIVDFNKLKTYEFSLVGTEVLNIQGRDYESIILQVVRKNERRKTQMWFSTERNYLPLQMVHFSKGKKKFNAHLVNYTEFDSGRG